MKPYRIVRSEAELDAVAVDSLVCPAYSLRGIYEKSAPNEWVEPGSEETVPTAALWEMLTGSYESLVMDEDREVWVLIDAAAPPPVRPTRPEGSPEYASRSQNRSVEFISHMSLEEARQAVEDAVGDGVTVGLTSIWRRRGEAYDYRAFEFVAPGTAVADFPWKKEGGSD